jgi:flagellar motility protein MotE (MotC chaperone)
MKSRIFLIVVCMFFFVAAVGFVRAEDSAKPEATPADSVKQAVDNSTKTVQKKSSPSLALSADAIQELENRKVALDQREKQLNERAQDLDLQEKILREKLKKMEELNKKMAERLDSFKKDHDDRIEKLKSVVEGMKPDAAARYVEALEPDLAVEILARIQIQKASKIMNLVDKKLGARLTELYTGYRDSIDDPKPDAGAAAPASATGKEATSGNKPM